MSFNCLCVKVNAFSTPLEQFSCFSCACETGEIVGATRETDNAATATVRLLSFMGTFQDKYQN